MSMLDLDLFKDISTHIQRYSRIFKDIQELRHTYLRGRTKVLSCIEDQESACKKHDDNDGDGDNNVDFDVNSDDDNYSDGDDGDDDDDDDDDNDDDDDDDDDDDNKINSPLAASVASERGKDTSGGGGRQPRMMTIAPMMMMMMMVMILIKTGGSLKGCFPRPRLVCVFDVFLNYTSFVTKEPN